MGLDENLGAVKIESTDGRTRLLGMSAKATILGSGVPVLAGYQKLTIGIEYLTREIESIATNIRKGIIIAFHPDEAKVGRPVEVFLSFPYIEVEPCQLSRANERAGRRSVIFGVGLVGDSNQPNVGRGDPGISRS